MAPPGNGNETGRPPCRRAQGRARSACRHPPGKEGGDRFPRPSGPGEVFEFSPQPARELPLARRLYCSRSSPLGQRATAAVACRGRSSRISLSPEWAPAPRKADFALKDKLAFLKIIYARTLVGVGQNHRDGLQAQGKWRGGRDIAADAGGLGAVTSKSERASAGRARIRSYNGRGPKGKATRRGRRSGRERGRVAFERP
jgi:hypothetical protein